MSEDWQPQLQINCGRHHYMSPIYKTEEGSGELFHHIFPWLALSRHFSRLLDHFLGEGTLSTLHLLLPHHSDGFLHVSYH